MVQDQGEDDGRRKSTILVAGTHKISKERNPQVGECA